MRSTAALALALLIVALSAWIDLASVSAHAAYVESDPPFAAVLDQPPDEIVLRFTQDLFRRDGANTISLQADGSGDAIALLPPLIDNADRRAMSADLPDDLPAGRYLVSWTNLSADDGDSDSGRYPFYIGREPSADEIARDRAIAADLLITYPGDESPAADIDAPSAAPVVAVADSGDDDLGGVGVGPVLWLVVALIVAVALIAAARRSRGGAKLRPT